MTGVRTNGMLCPKYDGICTKYNWIYPKYGWNCPNFDWICRKYDWIILHKTGLDWTTNYHWISNI